MKFLDIAVFTIISSIEYIAIMAFIFTVFRVSYKHMKYQVVFIALSLSYVSYSMRTAHLTAITPMVQLLLFFVLIWMVLKVHPFYSIIMALSGFLAYALIQGILVFAVKDWIDIRQAMTGPMYMVALVSSACSLGISYFLKRRRLGFAFVPHTEHVKVNMKSQENLALLITAIFSIVGVGIAFAFHMLKTDFIYMFILLLLLVLCGSLLFYLSTVKERIFFGKPMGKFSSEERRKTGLKEDSAGG
jgi:hypothetical protein